MNGSEFDKIVEARIDKVRAVLSQKQKEYATDGDKLHNFHRAGSTLGSSPESALWGFAMKHLISVQDMVQALDPSQLVRSQNSIEQWDEKIGDAINYLILLEALVHERDRMVSGVPST